MIVNDPFNYATESLEGLVRSRPHQLSFSAQSNRVVLRALPAPQEQVGILAAGGAGHLPAWSGFVGEGLLDASVSGDVLTAPSADEIALGLRSVGKNGCVAFAAAGTADRTVLETAAEIVALEGMDVRQVILKDDLTLVEGTDPRGGPGLLLAAKAAAAAARSGKSLDDVHAIAQRAAATCASNTIICRPPVLPQTGVALFELADGCVSVGAGLAGQEGRAVEAPANANELADLLLGPVLDAKSLGRGQRIALLLSGLGTTPAAELNILFRRMVDRLDAIGVTIRLALVAPLVTCLDAQGASLCVMALDKELEALVSAPANAPAWPA